MGTLYIVATPIGNLEDVTLRALRVLREADWILAEDTRRTRVLLDHFEIAQKPASLHAHNEASRVARVVDALAEGRSVALVSDAGTPLVSDPGARLVAAVASAGHRVEAVPGPSALLAAWSVSGIETEKMLFLGFLPRKAGARRAIIKAQRGRTEGFIVFESPRRVAQTLSEIHEILGDRRACLARELTKRHEEVLRDDLSGLIERLGEEAPRGECTVVVAGAAEGEALEGAWSDGDVDREIQRRLDAGESVRDLSTRIAEQASRSRQSVYARANVLRGEAGASGVDEGSE